MKTTKFKHAVLLPLAAQLAQRLEPYCTKIMIAGSIRRGKEFVSDVELVIIPKPKLYKVLDTWLERGHIAKRLNKRGNAIAWGNKYRAFEIHDPDIDATVPIDVFFCTPDNWGLTLLIRTGDGDANKIMVTQRLFNGAMPDNMFMKDGFLWVHPDAGIHSSAAKNNPQKYGFRRIRSDNEMSVYRAIGLPFLSPYLRDGENLAAWTDATKQVDLKRIMQAVNDPNDLHNIYRLDMPALKLYDRNTGEQLHCPRLILEMVRNSTVSRHPSPRRWCYVGSYHEHYVYIPSSINQSYDMGQLLNESVLQDLKNARAYWHDKPT